MRKNRKKVRVDGFVEKVTVVECLRSRCVETTADYSFSEFFLLFLTQRNSSVSFCPFFFHCFLTIGFLFQKELHINRIVIRVLEIFINNIYRQLLNIWRNDKSVNYVVLPVVGSCICVIVFSLIRTAGRL